MTHAQLQDAARKETESVIRLAETLYRRKLGRPEIRFDMRGRTAGMVRFPRAGRPVIRYNPGLLQTEGDAFLKQVIPHEVAHLVAKALHGNTIRPHGPEWRAIMVALGARPERCHDFDTSREPVRRLRRFDYHCGCRTHLLSSIRHKRIMQGTVYRCLACGQPLAAGDVRSTKGGTE